MTVGPWLGGAEDADMAIAEEVKSLSEKRIPVMYFADLGLRDAGERLIKAGLVVRIDQIVRERKLTQTAAGELMRIDPRRRNAPPSGRARREGGQDRIS